VLVNWFYASPVGHCLEALRYCVGYHAADPSRRIGLVLNASTPVELAALCPSPVETYAIDFPFGQLPGPATVPDLTDIPQAWDWVVEDPRARMAHQGFAGFRRYHESADHHLAPRLGRGSVGGERPSYRPHRALRLEPPADARERARRLIGDGQAVAVLPAGSGPAMAYPSVESWLAIMRRLTRNEPVALVLLGKTVEDERTATTITAADRFRLASEVPGTIDAFDLPLVDQLALLEAAEVLVSPHSGFGFLASCVGTAWTTISGGRWPEYFFNGAPFSSILPDPIRFPCYTPETGGPDSGVLDLDGTLRTPSMSMARIAEDLDRILNAVRELLAGTLSYDAAMAEHGRNITGFWSSFPGDGHPYFGEMPRVYSIDGDLDAYLPCDPTA
jgi:hypothetical protein